MISNLNFAYLSKSILFGYASKLSFFSGKSSLDFEPGLTILFGPNGCGKSTVLNMLALSLAAKQGGFSAVTEDHVRSTVDMLGALPHPRTGKRSGMQDKIGVAVAHDGQPVLFADPRQSVGISAAGFDNDFLGAGLSQAMALRGCSHGQVTAGERLRLWRCSALKSNPRKKSLTGSSRMASTKCGKKP